MGFPPVSSLQKTSEPAFFSSAVENARRFYLDLNPTAGQALTVNCGGLERCARNYVIHRATFPFYSFEYVARGMGQLRLQGKNFLLQPGAIFSYGPGVSHHITGDVRSPLVKYFVDFSGKSAVSFLKSFNLAPGSVARVFPPNALAALFDELIQNALNLRRGNTKLCVKLLECLALKITVVNAPLRGAETLAFATYQHCRGYIEENFRTLKTLGQIARECHVDRAYLCRLFRRYDQQSPYQYLLRLKTNYAAERLQQPDVLVKQASEMVGFKDPFHFSRVFRRLLGVAPVNFRKLR